MAPPTWATQEQQDFILTYQDEFLECKKKGNFATFWPPFFEKWEEQWPVEVSNDDQRLTEVQLAQEVAKRRVAVHKRLIVKLRNDFGNSKAGRRANAAGNTIVTKLIGGIVKKERKKSRPLKATEVYSKMYYTSRIQPAVKEELDAMKEASDTPDLKKRTIQVVRRQLASRWENETLEVKEEVASFIREMKDKREKDTSDCKILSKDLVISRLTEILSTFFSELHDSTGWAFSILLGGPDPANGGKLDVSSLHIGTTALGNWFNQACPKFKERVMVPYFEFASRAFPEAAISLSQSKEGEIANPNPQDDDEDRDLDRTILPMPPNYQPPARPPTLWGQTPGDVSLPTPQDAFPTYNFSTSPTHAAAPILADPAMPATALAPDSTSPTHTAATILTDPAVPATALSLDSTSPTHPAAPILTDPVVPTIVQPSIGTKPSKRKATKTNIESSNSDIVHARRRHKKGVTVAVSENSELIEGGRGKRQRFQSSWAASANAIGTNR